MKKPYENSAITDIEKASRGGVDAPSPALDIATLHGGRQMPVNGNIAPRGDSATGGIKIKNLPDAQELHRIFNYCPDTGVLRFKRRGPDDFEGSTNPEKSASYFNRAIAGSEITSKNLLGYIVCRIDGRTAMSHRVIWKMMFGTDPDIIDHINGDPSDNRLVNLRNVSASLNSRNVARKSNNKVGISGIRDKKPKAWGRRWVVVASENGRISGQKSFHCIGEAVRFRNADLRSRGFTRSHGIREASRK